MSMLPYWNILYACMSIAVVVLQYITAKRFLRHDDGFAELYGKGFTVVFAASVLNLIFILLNTIWWMALLGMIDIPAMGWNIMETVSNMVGLGLLITMLATIYGFYLLAKGAGVYTPPVKQREEIRRGGGVLEPIDTGFEGL